MDLWNDIVIYRLAELAKSDQYYQEYLSQLHTIEGSCQKILDTLSPQDREIVATYAVLIDEMEYRMAQLAYEYGKAHSV